MIMTAYSVSILSNYQSLIRIDDYNISLIFYPTHLVIEIMKAVFDSIYSVYDGITSLYVNSFTQKLGFKGQKRKASYLECDCSKFIQKYLRSCVS